MKPTHPIISKFLMPGVFFLCLSAGISFQGHAQSKKEYTDAEVSISAAGPEKGDFFTYVSGNTAADMGISELTMDHSGLEVVHTKSGDAVSVNMSEPRVRYYASEDSPQLTSDLRSALDGDVFILTSGGEEYLLDNWINITVKIKIMADEDLEERPILTVYKESNTVQTMRLYQDGCAIHAVGIEFDSKSRQPGEYPPKYAIRTNPDIGNYSLILEDCYFHGIWQANDGNSGSTIKLYAGTYADSIIIRNCIFEGDEGIVLNSDGDFSWDKFEITNCTFKDIPDEQAINIRQQGDRKNLPLLVDHCTFNNVGGLDEEVIRTDSLNKATLSNSILGPSPADTSWHLFGNETNQTMVDYINFFDCPQPLTDEGGVLGTHIWGYDPMFADPDNGNLTLGNNTLLDLGSDGLPLGDLRWADIFGPKVNPVMTVHSDSTLLVRFNEWIDTTTAELAANYALSGSADYAGPVKEAELFNFHAVLLTLDNFAEQVGNEIIITVNGVEDTLGNVLDPMHNSASYLVEEFRPIVTLEPQTLTNATGQKVMAQSNQQGGFVWIILEGEPQSSFAELEAAVTTFKGAKAEATEAFVDIEINVYAVEPGTYYAYATDENGNVSEKGVNTVTMTDGIPPTVTATIQSVTNGDDDAALAMSNEPGTIYILLDGENNESENDFISARYANKASSAEVAEVDVDIEVSTSGLVPGIYYPYAIDMAGNLSVKGSNPFNISQSTTNVDESGVASVKVYSSGQMIIIESPEADLDRAVIFDLTGKAILERKIESDRSEWMMEMQGIYFIRLERENQIIQTRKLVVN